MPKILIAESLELDTLKNELNNKTASLLNDDSYKNTIQNENSKMLFYYFPDFTPSDIERNISYFDGLIVRPKIVSTNTINNGKNLKIIVRGGAGLNSIDLVTAQKNNIKVYNTPGQNSISTAEFAFALLMQLAARRQIMDCYNDVINNITKPPEYYCGNELAGKKIAIIGMGHIGTALAKRCLAFDMQVVAYNRSKRQLNDSNLNKIPIYHQLSEIFKFKPDIISIHLALDDTTKNIIGDREFNLMQDNTILINVARPQLIDKDTLKRAVNNKKISRFAIDGDLDLIEDFIAIDENKIGIFTHHIADTTLQAQQKICRQVINLIYQFFVPSF